MVNQIENFPLILLAGGKSSRMGTPKGLLDYRGEPWLLEQLRRFKAACGKQVIVVLGFHHERYFKEITWLKTAGKESVHQLGLDISVVVNPNPEHGQFSSLQCAIHPSPTLPRSGGRAGVGVPGAFVLPVDVPGPNKGVYGRLTEALGVTTAAAIPRYQSRGGHPVLLSRAFLERLTTVSPSSTQARLDLQIKALPGKQVTFVPVDDEEVSLNMNIRDEFRNYALRKPRGLPFPPAERYKKSYGRNPAIGTLAAFPD